MDFENISGIIFDLDGTLTDYETGSETGLKLAFNRLIEASETSIPYEIFQDAYKGVIDAESAWSSISGFTGSAKENRVRRFQLLLQGLGRQQPGTVLMEMAEAYSQGRSSGTKLYADVIDTLAYLKNKYALAILTEGDETTQMNQITHLGIEPYFSTIVISDQTPWHKPSITLFRFAAIKMELEPENILMVGDRLDWDIRPAKEVGMKTIWLNRAGSRDNSPIEPDIVIQKLDELKKIL
ncbi:MAG: HAD family hydrolase [bacterium]